MPEQTLEERMKQHAQEDSARFARYDRVLFGDKDTEEMGMKEKVDTMYDILIQARGVGGFFTNIRNTVLLLVAIGGLISYIKGWWK